MSNLLEIIIKNYYEKTILNNINKMKKLDKNLF